MQKSFLYFLLVTQACLAVSPAMAEDGYTLFTPAPKDQMRPMTTERPSKTDSPYSLDAGHLQIESNLYGYTQNDDCNHDSCTKSRQQSIGGSTNLRVGLTDRTDIQFIGDIYRNQTVEDRTAGTRTVRHGYGDMLVRLKVNAFGNNPADSYALGILPYIKLPTNQDNLGNHTVEGGIGLPFNVNFSHGWSLGGMTQFNLVTDGDTGYDPAYANALMVGKALTDKLSTYTEMYTYKANQPGAKWLNTLDFGTVYSVTDNFRVDANVHFGVTDAADDVNIFIGTAYRF
jgi:hypothetical protein